MWIVYILQSLKNKSYYIGSTSNLTRRLLEHNKGQTQSTKHLQPLTLSFSQAYPTQKQARQIEFWLKSTHSKKIIEEIIRDGAIRKKITK